MPYLQVLDYPKNLLGANTPAYFGTLAVTKKNVAKIFTWGQKLMQGKTFSPFLSYLLQKFSLTKTQCIGRNDTQHNDTQYNDIEHNDILHNKQ